MRPNFFKGLFVHFASISHRVAARCPPTTIAPLHRRNQFFQGLAAPFASRRRVRLPQEQISMMSFFL
jgi:hypothetical protein